MRCAAIQGFVLILPPTLIQRDWWVAYTTFGIILTTLVNFACLSFARSALKRASAQRLSIAPEGRMASLETFAYWTPSSAFYSLALVGLTFMIHFGLAGDIFVYATGVAANNIILFYMIKCSGSSAATVRVALGRACVAAERLRYLQGPLADKSSEARRQFPAQRKAEPVTQVEASRSAE